MVRRYFTPIRSIKIAALSAVLSISSLSVHATETPDQVGKLLSQMSTALRETDYRGIFTYEHGGTLQTFQVTHQVVEGEEEEILENLNGPARRVERKGSSLNCLSPADQVLRGMLPTLDGSFNGLSQHYHFYVRNQERIAGRTATLLQIVPRDEYRHGYTLAIDTQSSLPLMAMTISSSRRVLERLQFAHIDLQPDDSWQLASTTAPAQQIQVAPTPCDSDELTLPQWSVSWMPSGFFAAGGAAQTDVGDVMQFTDGLSSFSVFIKPLDEGSSARGNVQRGATVAHMEQHLFNSKPHTVTVVGEIPVAAAERIADSVRVSVSVIN